MRWHAMAYVSILAFGLAMAAAGLAWGGAPGYYCTELVGDSNTYPPTAVTNSYGGSLLSNGTVIGETRDQGPGFPAPLPINCLASWNPSGTLTTVYTGLDTDDYENVFGDGSGRLAVGGTAGANANRTFGVFLYSGGTLSPIAQLQGSNALIGMSQNGLMAGYWQSSTGTAFAYDVATKSYYAIGPAGSLAQGVNGTYVVGGDGASKDGFVWNESNQSYTQIPALAAAQGISDNGQLVAGLTQGSNPNAAVYTPSGTLAGTYWAGEATGVNNSGLVIGDNASVVYNNASGPWTSHAMAYFPGWNDPQGVDLNAYAPAGVTFDMAQAVNDSGQILVWSNGYSWTRQAAPRTS